ncbi:hypothetical protein COO58_19220 [Micromonospora sp. WMMA1996]|uniref:hypothetical protein n=1 Tax=Micromonospora sp. WMMA1996 TaxID=2039878 RepID=UPI000C01F281|nr:hypothetical protein [Micromonospora sp. WMMA1996]PGH42926.1 hypothetical protein COO58_19220 [Micromonospora sp. WMMA1996]
MTIRRATSRTLAAVLLTSSLLTAGCGNDDRDATPAVTTSGTADLPATTNASGDYFSDESYLGKPVTVSGEVTRIIAPAVFVIDAARCGDDSVLVVAPDPMNVDLGTQTQVTGVVRRFAYNDVAADRELGGDINAYQPYRDEQFLLVDGEGAAGAGTPSGGTGS